MPRFSEFFSINRTQYELDFVDISNEYDTAVYVDPYAIEINDDSWAGDAAEYIRSFFNEVLTALRDNSLDRATMLMSHLREPRETFLGVSRENPRGQGVGKGQSQKLIAAITESRAYQTGLLTDLSEMALYVEGIDRDKISDLTTNIIRSLLVDYTQQQCALYDVETEPYSGPPLWDKNRNAWVSQFVQLPRIQGSPVLLVPKYIVRKNISINSQAFYNKQITDFLVSEHYRANDSLVHLIKGTPKVYKGEVREAHPISKSMIAKMVLDRPELLDMYKEMARRHPSMAKLDPDGPTLTSVCSSLSQVFHQISPGREAADDYHSLVMGSMMALFHPSLIQPRKEWEINDGRKRVDIVFTNAAETGFFAQRRTDHMVNANVVIVECKNYSSDIGNVELDQLIGRFDANRGRFGIITCRNIDNYGVLLSRLRDASSRSQGYVIALTDSDIMSMLNSKSNLNDNQIENLLFRKYRELLA